MNRKLSAICAVCLCAIIATALTSVPQRSTADDAVQESPQAGKDRWMTVKLNAAQQILADLTSGDFDQLEKSARRMQVMNFMEQWQRDAEVKRKSDYQGQLNAFEFSTKELIRYAGDQDTEGALGAYVALTQSCVRCHQLIRDGH